jgi:Cu+-exporting ATPase
MAHATTELEVTGMSCSNCARHVTEAIQGVAGVRSATVNLEQNKAVVRWADGNGQPVDEVIGAVRKAGFEAKEIEDHDHGDHGHACCGAEPSSRTLAGWQISLWVGVLGTIPLMLGEWVFGLGLAPWFQWVSFGIAAVVQVVSGAGFYRGAWRQLKAGSANMDALVALGSTTAFAYSAWALFTGAGGHIYFMEAASIITLVSVGHWVESRVSTRASSALEKLLHLTPNTARRREPDGSEREVPVADLNKGDLVALRPGDRVATDGEVVEGSSSVDEAMLTGESTPVDKEAHSSLYAGTANVNGRLLMRVSATGEETALAHIIAAVQRAQSSRAEIQRLGDRVSSVFVPIIVTIALAAGLWWGLAPGSANAVHDWLSHFLWHAHPPTGTAAAFIIAAGVLIIACPCAMGLATPAAIMAASNAASQRGILVRDGVALEQAGKVTAVLFDKTGTLTLGKPVVDNWKELGAGSEDVARLAVGLARHSNHPISRAVATLSKDGTEVADWEEVRGGGVQAKNGKGETVRLGSLRWLQEARVDLSGGKEFIDKNSKQGATIVGLAVEKSLHGVFAVKDAVKPGAREVVEQLKTQGLKVYLVTGDNSLTATSIAQQAGIKSENVFAEVRPEQKAELVAKLQKAGERVAFVGDGINDAPAIEQADLGIAVSRASDIAREAADIILLNSEIEAVPESLSLARATLRTIKQNLFWAFFYNAIGVPLAALGFMSPIFCAAAMGFSDIIVIGNALRLRKHGSNR